jgi:hypothetical protein
VLTVFVQAKSVEALLMRASVAVSPESMVMWLSGPMKSAIQGRAQERFVNEGDDVSNGPWEQLSEATQNWRNSYGFGPSHPINVRSGQLEDYVTRSAAAVVPTSWGASMVYPGSPPGGGALAGTLHTKFVGAQRGEGSAPPREVLGLTTTDLELGLTSLTGWIVAALAGRGRS